jgi:hypothetical protein
MHKRLLSVAMADVTVRPPPTGRHPRPGGTAERRRLLRATRTPQERQEINSTDQRLTTGPGPRTEPYGNDRSGSTTGATMM